jgi:hypothetical protein
MSVAPALVLDTLQSPARSRAGQHLPLHARGHALPHPGHARHPQPDRTDGRRQRPPRRRPAELITSLGGLLRPESVHPANQYLSFLTLKFLLPKLADAKRNTIERYENALRALPLAPPEVMRVLNAHLADHRADLATLEETSKIAR